MNQSQAVRRQSLERVVAVTLEENQAVERQSLDWVVDMTPKKAKTELGASRLRDSRGELSFKKPKLKASHYRDCLTKPSGRNTKLGLGR